MYKLFLLILIGFLPDKSNTEKNVIEFQNQLPTVILKQDSVMKSKLEDFKFVYTLSNKSENYLGDVYVKEVNDSVFSSLLIIEELKNSNVKLYEVNNYTFFNKNGIDIKIRQDEFWGYKFELKKKDYFVLTALHNKGANVSDAIYIKWNYKDQIFEVRKTP